MYYYVSFLVIKFLNIYGSSNILICLKGHGDVHENKINAEQIKDNYGKCQHKSLSFPSIYLA